MLIELRLDDCEIWRVCDRLFRDKAEHPLARASALWILGQSASAGNELTERAVILLHDRSENGDLRRTAARALCEIDRTGRTVGPMFLRFLEIDNPEARRSPAGGEGILRYVVFEKLSRMKLGERELPSLLKFACDPSEDVLNRKLAIQVLGQVEPIAVSAIEPLYSMLKDHRTDRWLFYSLVSTLKNIMGQKELRGRIEEHLHESQEGSIDRRHLSDLLRMLKE
jgi:hypothetical protein